MFERSFFGTNGGNPKVSDVASKKLMFVKIIIFLRGIVRLFGKKMQYIPIEE